LSSPAPSASSFTSASDSISTSASVDNSTINKKEESQILRELEEAEAEAAKLSAEAAEQLNG
jgi:hypothetical protein